MEEAADADADADADAVGGLSGWDIGCLISDGCMVDVWRLLVVGC